jgi:hypothetical protein
MLMYPISMTGRDLGKVSWRNKEEGARKKELEERSR